MRAQTVMLWLWQRNITQRSGDGARRCFLPEAAADDNEGYTTHVLVVDVRVLALAHGDAHALLLAGLGLASLITAAAEWSGALERWRHKKQVSGVNEEEAVVVIGATAVTCGLRAEDTRNVTQDSTSCHNARWCYPPRDSAWRTIAHRTLHTLIHMHQPAASCLGLVHRIGHAGASRLHLHHTHAMIDGWKVRDRGS